MTKYRLYVLKTDADGIAKASATRFSRLTGNYILVYTEEKMQAPEITEEEIWRLTEMDSRWLLKCNIQLALEDFRGRQEEIAQTVLNKLKIVEDELAKKQRAETAENPEKAVET